MPGRDSTIGFMLHAAWNLRWVFLFIAIAIALEFAYTGELRARLRLSSAENKRLRNLLLDRGPRGLRKPTVQHVPTQRGGDSA
jgi:hypothetical protein